MINRMQDDLKAYQIKTDKTLIELSKFPERPSNKEVR
jgi:hypothetical protein